MTTQLARAAVPADPGAADGSSYLVDAATLSASPLVGSAAGINYTTAIVALPG